MRLVAIVLLTTIVTSIVTSKPALCQSRPAPVSRLDIAASLGAFSANHDEVADYDAWTHSLFGGLNGGLYWTDHHKSEVEVAWTGQGETYGSEAPPVPGTPFAYVLVEHSYSNFKVSAAQLYQFGRNARAHPFIGAGVDIDRERHTTERVPLGGPLGRGPSFPDSSRTETKVRAWPFTTIGLKAYFSERVFFRTDLKLSFTDRVEQAIWKTGVGIDF